MIRAIGSDENGMPVVFFGLDDENLRRLKFDQPIRINLARLDPDGVPTDLPSITVVIFHATPESTALLRENQTL